MIGRVLRWLAETWRGIWAEPVRDDEWVRHGGMTITAILTPDPYTWHDIATLIDGENRC